MKKRALSPWQWMPVSVFVLGMLSIGLLVWIDRVAERHYSDFGVADALMDMRGKAATGHLWLEEGITGENREEMALGIRDIEFALALSSAVLDGGKSEHDLPLTPVRDPLLRRDLEDIRSLLTRFHAMASKRIQDPGAGRVGSTLDEQFDDLFGRIEAKAGLLETILERKQIQGHSAWRGIFIVISFAWFFIVLAAALGLWNRESRRRAAEAALKSTNAALEVRTMELRKHEERLSELVEERTADLGKANESLRHEVAERKDAEQSLRTSENRFRTLVENLPMQILQKDRNSVYVYCNDNFARELGLRVQDILGRTDYDLHPREQAERYVAEDREVFDTGRAREMEERYLRRGQEAVIQKIKLPVRGEGGDRADNLLCIIWDVTERIRLESIAEAANTMNNIGYVFSGIRHEIGNPVNSVKMTLSVLKGKLEQLEVVPASVVHLYVDRAMTEMSRMEYLLRALKNFNMYETMELKNLPMKPFVDAFLSLAARDLRAKGIQITSRIESETTRVYADPRALQQVMLNILSNAVDALEERKNPEIHIGITGTNGFVTIAISDNGCGISEKQQSDLFKPFRTTKPGGTGLGLVITKKMVTGMRGTIDVHSRPGEGTMISISIPEAPDLPHPPIEVSPIAAPTSQSIRDLH